MLKIMIVDEHWADIPVFKRLLTEFPGSQVSCFPNYHRAYRECPSHAPDILVIDDDLSKAAPIAFARRLRKLSGMHESVIMLMSSQREGLAGRARYGGIDACMPKPLDTDLFVTLLHNAARLHAARTELATMQHGRVLRS
jgi:DNA-binding NarL/FixJ family response regulator